MDAISLEALVDRTVPFQSLPAPIDRRLRRLALTGTGILAAFLAYLELAWRLLDPSRRPRFVLIGWGVLGDTVSLYGHALLALRGSIATLGTALVLTIATRGFRLGRCWSQVACLLIGLAGLAALIPLLVAVVVLALNVTAWMFLVVTGLAAFAAVVTGGPADHR